MSITVSGDRGVPRPLYQVLILRDGETSRLESNHELSFRGTGVAELGAATESGTADCLVIEDRFTDDPAVQAVIQSARIPVVVVGPRDPDRAIRAFRLGAGDYFYEEDLSAGSLIRWLKAQRAERKKAAVEGEDFLAALTSVAPVLLYIYDLEQSRNVWINDSLPSILGYSAAEVQEFAGNLLASLIHPDDLIRYPKHQDSLRRLRPEETAEFEYRMRHKNGSWIWLRSHERAFARNARGEVVQIAGAAQDVTAWKTAQQEKIQTAELLRTLIESTTDLVWSKDRGGRITLANQATYDLLGGGNPARVLGRSPFELFPDPKQAAQVAETDARVLKIGRPETFEEEFGDAQSVRIFQTLKAPLRSAAGIVGIVGVSRDITQSRRALDQLQASEEALRRNEERLRLAMEVSGTGLWEWRLSDDSVTYSPECFSITGIDPEKFDGRSATFDQLLHPEDRERVWDAIRHAIATHSTFDCEFRVVRGDGSVCWLWNLGRATYDEQGDPLTMTGTVTDITERKKADEALRENQERQAFLMHLSDVLRPILDAEEIKYEAARLLGNHLNAGRAGYAETDGDQVTIARHYVRGLSPIDGVYHIGDYGPNLEKLAAGQYAIRTDIPHDPELTEQEKAAFRALPLAAMANVPLVKNGRLLALLFVHHRDPHEYSESELSLMSEVAERTWAAVERARTEAALRESEERYRALFESIDEAVMVIERVTDRPDGLRDYRYVSMNPVSRTMFGISDLTGQSVRDNFPEEDEGWYDLYDQALATGEVARFERETASQGMTLQMYIARVNAPEKQRLMVVIQDVTLRKQAEAQLLRSNALKGFLVKLNDAIRPLADPMEIQYVAAKTLGEYLNAERAGYAEFDSTGRSVLVAQHYATESPLIPGYYRLDEFNVQLLERLHAGKVSIVCNVSEDPGLTDEQKAAHANIRVGATADLPIVKSGRLVALLFVHYQQPHTFTPYEITLMEEVAERTWAAVERARAERAVRIAQERLQMSVDTCDIGIGFTNLITGEMTANTVLLSHLGLPPDARVTPEVYIARVHPEDREIVQATWGRVVQHGEPFDSEYRLVDDSGRMRWVRAIGRSTRTPEGRVENFYAVTLDITDQKMIEETLRSTNEDLNRFTYAVAHDLREPLRNVGTSTEMLPLVLRRAGYAPDPELERLRSLITEGVRRMDRMLVDLLEYSHAGSDHDVLADTDLNVVLQSAIANLQSVIADSGTVISVAPLPTLPVRGAEIASVFQNLINNAIKYRGPEPPRISIHSEKCSGEWVISVEDNGEGVAPEYLRHIFGMFKRLHGREVPGTGIGLAICEKIVSKHGGRIWAESERGKGSAFRFTLPARPRGIVTS